jgi:hypothetical protein
MRLSSNIAHRKQRTADCVCVLYRHGAFLYNQIGPEVPLTTFLVVKPVTDFGHVIRVISTCTVMAVMLCTYKVMTIYRAHANNGNLLLCHSTKKCTYFAICIYFTLSACYMFRLVTILVELTTKYLETHRSKLVPTMLCM